MRTQKQRSRECMLATIATLAGISLSEISERARRLQGGKGFNVPGETANNKDYWGTVKRLVQELGLEGLVPYSRKEYLKRLSADAWELSPPRRGEWGSMVYESGFLCSHIVAFRNGYVYDSGVGARMSVKAWYDMVYEGGAYVVAIWRQPCE